MRMAIGPTVVGWRKFEMTVQNGDILGSLSVGIPCFIMSCPFFCSFFLYMVFFFLIAGTISLLITVFTLSKACIDCLIFMLIIITNASCSLVFRYTKNYSTYKMICLLLPALTMAIWPSTRSSTAIFSLWSLIFLSFTCKADD